MFYFVYSPSHNLQANLLFFIKFHFYSQYVLSIEHNAILLVTFKYEVYYNCNNFIRYELIGIPLHFYSCVKRLQILMRQYIQYHVAQSY